MGDGLFELRARGPEGIGRVFYCTQVGQRIVVLHSFVKKTQETPDGELRIARKRMKEVRING
jgi:phage-related protein